MKKVISFVMMALVLALAITPVASKGGVELAKVEKDPGGGGR